MQVSGPSLMFWNSLNKNKSWEFSSNACHDCLSSTLSLIGQILRLWVWSRRPWVELFILHSQAKAKLTVEFTDTHVRLWLTAWTFPTLNMNLAANSVYLCIFFATNSSAFSKKKTEQIVKLRLRVLIFDKVLEAQVQSTVPDSSTVWWLPPISSMFLLNLH